MALWDDSPSDGVFRFYWADHEEFEYAHGPFGSFAAAKAHALKQAVETTFGPEPGVTIYVCEADKRTTVPPAFDTQALLAEYKATGALRFDSEAVLDLFMEANEDCWGEDGWDGLTGDAEAAAIALISALTKAAGDWIFIRSPDDVTAEEDLQRLLQNAFRVWEVAHRAQIKTWMFGQMKDPQTFVIPEMTPAELAERNIRSLMRMTGLPREQIEAAQRGDHESIQAYLATQTTTE
ncbi:hypothetical protein PAPPERLAPAPP_00640 [Brevundimonas phage vB_BpoS-Papperlapapp]|uniref:Uncharacterized protein n=1 Tax=Brevundimonas phage vB_BpoS-Domovoi TaxID=2948598 RepID=A0A9E7MSP2_9CAUD|nr:hypothetical protein DOMOVOI_05410 [Brevundimonas phage vB_BpoS-Domovoi]USN15806.1 hypothetical protein PAPPERLAPAPP_00640 [Brevundimonas phage vB_BpoS-Papperlapapp]